MGGLMEMQEDKKAFKRALIRLKWSVLHGEEEVGKIGNLCDL